MERAELERAFCGSQYVYAQRERATSRYELRLAQCGAPRRLIGSACIGG